MKLDIFDKISDIAFGAVGVRPVAMAESGRGRVIQIEFDPALDGEDQDTLLAAMPEWLKLLYSFEEKVGTLIPTP